MKKISFVFLSLFLILFKSPAWSDEFNLPDLGDSSQTRFSPVQEREIGEKVMKALRRSGDLVEDPEIVDYLNQLGQKLVEAARVDHRPFTFFSLRDKSVNAFAIPGGFIGVNTGLIMTTQQESELAGVLAHEMAHLTQHHIARMVEAMRANSPILLSSIALAALAAIGGRGDAAFAGVMSGLGIGVQRQLSFTYAFEQEADRVGMQTLIRAGFDPAAMPTFFERLQRYNRFVETNAPEFLRTHPVTYKRIADAQARLKALPYRQTPDSSDFFFIKEKVRCLQMEPLEAIAFYKSSIVHKRYTKEVAAQYGYAYARYLNRNYNQAKQSLEEAQRVFGKNKNHPAFVYLAAQILIAQKKFEKAILFLKEAMKEFPGNRSLIYSLVDAQMSANQYPAAQIALNRALALYPSDPWLWQGAAKAYQAQNRLMEWHRAQAEYYYYQQAYPAAIEQLEIALKQPGNDFYLISGIEARLKELRSKDHTSN